MNLDKIRTFIDEYEEHLPKLIRDKIPEIIKNNEGEEAKCIKAVSDSEVVEFAIRKLLEESGEMYFANTKDEIVSGLGDILELVELIKLKTGISETDIDNYKKNKNDRAGEFKKNLVLYEK